MNNEDYLIYSYFTAGFLSILLGTLVYLLLRSSLQNALANLVDSRFASMINRFFAYGLIFPAFAGFASVAYKTCTVKTYEKVIESRTYLMHKNVEQAYEVFAMLIYALLVWAVIVAVFLAIHEYRMRVKIDCKSEVVG